MGKRIYYIVLIIKQQTKPISAKEIQNQLLSYGMRIDIKTVYASIHRINEFYHALTGETYIGTIHRRGYSIEHHYFEDGELQFLLDSIGFNPNLSNQEIQMLQEKIINLSDAMQKQHVTLVPKKERKQTFSLLLNLSTLLKAIIQQQPIYFRYVNYKIVEEALQETYSTNGNITIDDAIYYLISPYQIVLRGGNYYVIGYFEKRENQLSMYRVDRMRFIRYHKSEFIDIKEQFDINKNLEKNVNMFISDEKIDIVFKFKDSILREVVNQFGIDIEVSKDVDGWNMGKVKDIMMSDGLIGWIMMLQDQIEIILPITLRETIVHKIEAIQQLYKE